MAMLCDGILLVFRKSESMICLSVKAGGEPGSVESGAS